MSESADLIEFGPFRLDPARRTLWRGDTAVQLSSRAYDILQLLVEKRGQVVTKDEILTTVWRGVIVEENNLAVQISALRRALSEGHDGALILTVPGQGYRFVGEIARPPPPAAPPAPQAAPPSAEAPAPIMSPPPAPIAPTHRAARRWPWIALACAAALGVTLTLLLRHPAPPPAPPAPPRLSIAVLPFRDLSDDRCCDYLADAISDDLTTDLSHIPGSVVIARESSDAFRGRALPTADIGRALNVRYLLEGSLRAVEGQFSINAQLIEAASGHHLWAERFTVPRAKLGEAQDSIVQRLASALGVKLVDIEGARAARAGAQAPDALDLFFRARSILDRSDTLASMAEAQNLLEKAIAKQPDFADGLAELAWLLPRKASMMEPEADLDIAEARRVSADALRAAPGSALALAARGALLSYDSRCDEARPSFEAALTAEPDNVPARVGLVVCLTKLGHFEDARQRLLELLRIDPEGPANKVRYYRLGFASLVLGHPDEALDWLARSTIGDPEPAQGAEEDGRVEWTRLAQIAALQMSGQADKAHAAYTSYAAIWPNRTASRLEFSFTKAQASLPGVQAMLTALTQAGMPRATDEHADFGVPPVAKQTAHRLCEPTPVSMPGATLIDTATLRDRLKTTPPLRIINVDALAVTLPGTIPCNLSSAVASDFAACRHALTAAGNGPIVVMAANAMDWFGYNGALALTQAGVGEVFWYRGGAEAWAAAGAPSIDARPE